MQKLTQVKTGHSAVVASVEGSSRLVARMMELGFVPGAMVEVIRRAPLGDPIKYRIRNSRISIRREEADCIQVIPNESSDEPSGRQELAATAIGSE